MVFGISNYNEIRIDKSSSSIHTSISRIILIKFDIKWFVTNYVVIIRKAAGGTRFICLIKNFYEFLKFL